MWATLNSYFLAAALALVGQASVAQTPPPSLDSLAVASLLGQASLIDQEMREHYAALGRANSPAEEAEAEKHVDEAAARLKEVLLAARTRAEGSPDLLLDVATAAADHGSGLPLDEGATIALDSARAALKYSSEPSLRLHRVHAKALYLNASGFASFFQSEDERTALLLEAKVHGETALSLSSPPLAPDLLQFGQILTKLSGQEAEAHTYFQRALATAESAGEANLSDYLKSLFQSARDLERPEEALRWFGVLRQRNEATIVYWGFFAELLDEQKRYTEAGEAWAGAARIAGAKDPDSEYSYWCQAGGSYWLAEDEKDAALAALRECIELGTLAEDSDEELSEAHKKISDILFWRGVYDQSVVDARQATALKPEDGWAFYYLARSLNPLGLDEEAAAAAQRAVRLTDGSYAFMHFELGAAYFDLEDWDRAEVAFEKAAEMDESDWTAAYNVALCLQRQGFLYDAAKWYEEVLRRKPDHPDREEILVRIQQLRR